MKFRLLLFPISLLCISAISQNTNSIGGEVFKVQVNTDSSLTYRTYIPKNYSEKDAAALFIFDPSGNAMGGMNNFIEAAEKCNTILFCSDQSRNGPFDRNYAIFESMYTDAKSKFTFNENKIFTTGFSGGSRLATYLAVRKSFIAGVIACGAGLPVDPNYQPSVISKFGYYGIIGRKDMNYTEMLKVEKFMQEKNIDHYMSFNMQGHQWPSPPELTKAMLWHLSRWELKNNIDESYFKEYISAEKKELNQLYKNGNLLDYHIAKNSLEKVFSLINKKIEFKNIDEEDIKERHKNREALIEKEGKLIQLYYDEYQRGQYKLPDAKPISWWKDEMTKWAEIEKSPSVESALSAARIRNFITAYAYQSTFGLIEEKEYEKAFWFTDILIEISDRKAYLYFIKAKIHALKKEYKSAEKALEKAIENGLDKKSYLLDEPAFKGMHERKKFKKLTEGLK